MKTVLIKQSDWVQARYCDEVYLPEQIKAREQFMAKQAKMGTYFLMERAGHALFQLFCRITTNQEVGRVVVVCGSGNNGGDGYIFARLLINSAWMAKQGAELIVIAEKPPRSAIDAGLAYRKFLNAGGSAQPLDTFTAAPDDFIVDALIGAGLNGPVRDKEADAISIMNAGRALGACVLSVDIPSGLDAKNGQPLGQAVSASHCLTFIAVKPGLLTGQGPDWCGSQWLAPLTDQPIEITDYFARCVRYSDVKKLIVKRRLCCHKGDFGHVVVIAGNNGMGGAGILASESAMRSGCGWVTLLTHENNQIAALTRCPEMMVVGIGDDIGISETRILNSLEKASVIVLGPGLGEGPWAENLARLAYSVHKPMVVDADGLRYLRSDAGHSQVITPHPGEAARLLGCSTEEILAERWDSAIALACRFNCHALLKGRGSLLTSPTGEQLLVDEGSPAMAVAGMGDILAGLLGGIMAQGYDIWQALQLAVAIHAKAGEQAGLAGIAGTRATDLLPHLRTLLNP